MSLRSIWNYFFDFDFFAGFSFADNSFSISAALLSTAFMIS